MSSPTIMKICNVPASWLLTLSRATVNEVTAVPKSIAGIARKRTFQTLQQYHGTSTGMKETTAAMVEFEEITSPPRIVWIGYGLFMTTALCQISLTPATTTTTSTATSTSTLDRNLNRHHIVSSSASDKIPASHQYLPKFQMKRNRHQTHW